MDIEESTLESDQTVNFDLSNSGLLVETHLPPIMKENTPQDKMELIKSPCKITQSYTTEFDSFADFDELQAEFSHVEMLKGWPLPDNKPNNRSIELRRFIKPIPDPNKKFRLQDLDSKACSEEDHTLFSSYLVAQSNKDRRKQNSEFYKPFL